MTRLTRMMLNGTTCDKCVYGSSRHGETYCEKVGNCLNCKHKVKHKNVWGYDCICLQEPSHKELETQQCAYYTEDKR